jgi:hypothetical protein
MQPIEMRKQFWPWLSGAVEAGDYYRAQTSRGKSRHQFGTAAVIGD